MFMNIFSWALGGKEHFLNPSSMVGGWGGRGWGEGKWGVWVYINWNGPD